MSTQQRLFPARSWVLEMIYKLEKFISINSIEVPPDLFPLRVPNPWHADQEAGGISESIHRWNLVRNLVGQPFHWSGGCARHV
jgi:hypothetical protein